MSALYVKLCGITDDEITTLRTILLEEVVDNSVKANIQTLDTASIRTTSNQGIRYACYVDEETRYQSAEYGFLVAAKSKLIEANPNDTTYESLAFNSNGDKTGYIEGTKIKYTSSAAYVKDDFDESVFLTLDEAKETFPEKAMQVIEDDGYYFTVVLINLPESRYNDAVVGRPYVKIGEQYYYGTPVVKSIYSVAKELAQKDGLSPEVKAVVDSIIEKCETLDKDIGLDYEDFWK